ncbi:MAG: hypothetical protein WCD76_06765 [Pyrinomonadaceae bacterium]
MNKLKLMLSSFAIGAILMAAPLTVLACSRTMLTNQLGDGVLYTCYNTGEDEYYCYYDCYANSNQ